LQGLQAGRRRFGAAAIDGATMKPLMFYIGGNCGNSDIELHDKKSWRKRTWTM
jgi:hypothetical protein